MFQKNTSIQSTRFGSLTATYSHLACRVGWVTGDGAAWVDSDSCLKIGLHFIFQHSPVLLLILFSSLPITCPYAPLHSNHHVSPRSQKTCLENTFKDSRPQLSCCMLFSSFQPFFLKKQNKKDDTKVAGDASDRAQEGLILFKGQTSLCTSAYFLLQHVWPIYLTVMFSARLCW